MTTPFPFPLFISSCKECKLQTPSFLLTLCDELIMVQQFTTATTPNNGCFSSPHKRGRPNCKANECCHKK